MNPKLSKKKIKYYKNDQINLPKEFKDMLNLGNNYTLKLSLDDDKLVVEPVKKINNAEYAKSLLTIKGDWFSYEDYKNTRKQINDRLANNEY